MDRKFLAGVSVAVATLMAATPASAEASASRSFEPDKISASLTINQQHPLLLVSNAMAASSGHTGHSSHSSHSSHYSHSSHVSHFSGDSSWGGSYSSPIYTSGSGYGDSYTEEVPDCPMPEFGTPTPQAKGFKVKVLNYGNGNALDSTYKLKASTPLRGGKIRFSKGWITITGMKPGARAKANLTVSRSDCVTVTGSVVGASIAPAQSFSIEEVRKTVDGFVFIVYGPTDSSFSVHIDKGSLSGQQEDGTFIVSEMFPNQTNKVTVTLRQPGHKVGIRSKTMKSGQLVPNFSLSFVSRVGDSVVYRINGYDAASSYSVLLGQPSDPVFDISQVNFSVLDGLLRFDGVPAGIEIPFTVTASKAPYFERVVSGTIR